MPDSAQRSEKATPRRLEKARKEGDFPAAREFVSALQFFAFMILAASYFPHWIQGVQAAVRIGLKQAFAAELKPADLIGILNRLAGVALRPLAILGLFLMAITFLLQMLATNLGFSLARLPPNFARLNPATRLKQVPGNNLGHFIQAVVLIPVMFWLTCSLVRDRLPEILRLPSMPVVSSAAAAGMLLHDGLKKASFVLVILGAFMLVRERSRYGKRMRMSKQDIRDENRETEGNPQIKARIRRLQRDMRRKNMMREVATATAVVVNPTHYAVALRYDQAGMTAPQGGRQGAKITSPRAFASVPLKIWYQSLRILPSRRHCISPWKSGRRYHRIFTVR